MCRPNMSIIRKKLKRNPTISSYQEKYKCYYSGWFVLSILCLTATSKITKKTLNHPVVCQTGMSYWRLKTIGLLDRCAPIMFTSWSGLSVLRSLLCPLYCCYCVAEIRQRQQRPMWEEVTDSEYTKKEYSEKKRAHQKSCEICVQVQCVDRWRG